MSLTVRRNVLTQTATSVDKMGCASSAALPFLTGKGTPAVTESANGKPTYELKMKEGMNGVKDMSETYVSDKMKEVVDSSTVQGVIGSVVGAKDELVSQVQGAGETIVNKMSSVVEGMEESIDSTLTHITNKIEEVEENVKSEVKGVGDKISSMIGSAEETVTEKQDEIDELLAALPEESDIAAQSKAAAEELIEAATEEVTEDEMKD